MQNDLNRLHQESSPYLLQHADNPVNWFTWGEEALQRAKKEDKPILLSIGYSACHWCHVMAHESFEDQNTAALMNEYFINIKVDREERPDLDKIYQLSHQLLTGRPGGWPLTLVLTPQGQVPFFGGTYFPPVQRHGLRSFPDILQAIHKAWNEHRDEIKKQNSSLQQQLQTLSSSDPPAVILDNSVFELLSQQLMSQYDARYGGFTQAPKFPHPYSIERTLRQRTLYGDKYESLLQAGLHSLKQMARGGLFDHIGGGFCRYSTDQYWMIPHFEKMLYDNAQLLPLYAWAHQVDSDDYIQHAVTQTTEWLKNEMQHTNGGYYSAQDADSEGEEGRYYLWTPEQTNTVLSEVEAQLFNQSYGLDRQPNFEGKWYPHCFVDSQQLALSQKRPMDEIQRHLDNARLKLYQQRLNRIRPGTDDKILTSWNALMVRGMNISARVFRRDDYQQSAFRALRFIQQTLWQDGRLYATSKGGKAHLNAYLDDYAYLLLAIVDALQNEWNNELYEWAKQLADRLLDLFEDNNRGGFYFTSNDHEQLIMRSKSHSDDAMPSGNGIAASALQTLGLLSGNMKYMNSAEKTLQQVSVELNKSPILYCSMLNALDSYLQHETIVILRGETDNMFRWKNLVFERYLPNVLCYAIPADIEPPNELADKKPLGETVCAYICEGFSCREPITSFDEFSNYIKERSGSH